MEIHNPSVTGSLLLSGSLTSTGTITTLGTLVAQTLVVQDVTSSRDFVTGSSKFGSLSTNTHQFTGSVSMITDKLFIGSNQGGDEGGEILLAKPQTNNSITGSGCYINVSTSIITSIFPNTKFILINIDIHTTTCKYTIRCFS